MLGKEYHLNANPLPEGFRIFINYVPVKGLALRKKTALKFCQASGQQVRLQAEPTNAVDFSAIMVLGSWTGWLGRTERQLGYMPAEHAAKLVSLGLADKVKGRLLKTYVGSLNFVEIEIQVLGPKDLYDRFAPPLAAPASVLENDPAVLARVDTLTAYLAQTAIIPTADLDSLRKAAIVPAFDAMAKSGFNFGVVSDGHELPKAPEEEFRAHLRSIDNDLAAQVDIVDVACRKYFETGEVPAPYYPWRMAVILAKRKEKERERNFLAAWCRHFASGHGARYEALVARAEKLGAIAR